MSFMSGISSFSSIQHEPLNVDRVWGDATLNFSHTADEQRLRVTIRENLKSKPNIKHCFDVVPATVTKVLIEECLKRNYSFFFLNRRSEKSRLESLFLALSTGAWGVAEANRVYPKIVSGEFAPDPVDLKKAQVRIRQDMISLGQTISMLRNRCIDFEWFLYEEVYANQQSKRLAAYSAASRLGLTVANNDRRLEIFCLAEGQKSQSIKEFVPGFSDLIDALEKSVIE